MKGQIFITILAIAALGMGSAKGQECCTQTQPYIEVRGSASLSIEPNRVDVNVMLSEADSKGKVKLAELESQLALALKKAGVDASKQLVITSQSSNAAKRVDMYQYKNYILTLSSAGELATVFDAFAEFGVSNATVGRVWNDKQSEFEAQVKIQAMKNAQQNAILLASALGQSIGVAILVQDYSSTPSPMDGNGLMMARSFGKGESAATLPEDLSLRKITIVQSVTARFILNYFGARELKVKN